MRFLRIFRAAALVGALAGMPLGAMDRFIQDAYMYSKLEEQKCLENQLKLYRCLSEYAARHEGWLPKGHNFEGLRQLGPAGANFAMFRCAGSKARKAKNNEAMREENNPFIYFGGMNLAQARALDPNIPLLMDKPGARHWNIVYVNGQTGTIDTAGLSRKFSTCRQMVMGLHAQHHYSNDVLAALLTKADAIDKAMAKR